MDKIDTDWGEQAGGAGAERPDRRAFLGGAAAVAAPLLASGTLVPSAAAARTRSPLPAAVFAPAPLAEVAGKVAFITGGSSGIGLGLARAFSGAGMKVIFTYLKPEHRDGALAQFKAGNAGVHAIRVDVTDRPGLEQAAAEATRVFGKVHLLCANAGVGPPALISTASYQDWDWTMAVNVDGVFNTIRAFLPGMLAHGEGAHVMATSSSGGIIAGTLGVYCTSKFAVVGMMESLRTEMSGRNVGVSVFCPGLVRSDIRNSERNRPAEFANQGGQAPDAPLTMPGSKPVDMMAAAMDPLTAGELVLAGIRRNDLYILTHQEFEQASRQRCDALLASFPREPAPPARIEVVKTYTPDIYAVEIERKRRQRR
ncbi:MAG: SDR family NAD(P)-dependent oxidoreductase [Gammaproteobacteria bacterium]|nr:SDR family NAD(P)-dependent oxidoreductase [Gammaproteobacteria bacterium]